MYFPKKNISQNLVVCACKESNISWDLCWIYSRKNDPENHGMSDIADSKPHVLNPPTSPHQTMDAKVKQWRKKNRYYKYIWLVVWTPLKNISQLGWLFPIYGKIKNVPNHQPDIVRFHSGIPHNDSPISPRLTESRADPIHHPIPRGERHPPWRSGCSPGSLWSQPGRSRCVFFLKNMDVLSG